MADLMMRSIKLTVVINGLVSQTSLKNAGKLRRACSRSLNVNDCVFAFLGGLLSKTYPSLISKNKDCPVYITGKGHFMTWVRYKQAMLNYN